MGPAQSETGTMLSFRSNHQNARWWNLFFLGQFYSWQARRNMAGAGNCPICGRPRRAYGCYCVSESAVSAADRAAHIARARAYFRAARELHAAETA